MSGRGVSSVQWQLDSPAPGLAWTNIPGATGNSLSVTAALAGSTVRALVTYESTVPNEPGVTAVCLPWMAMNWTVTIRRMGTDPVLHPPAQPPWATHEITGSVMGTGHTAARGPVTGVGEVTSGHTVSITETVDLASLFQDPDSARLSFIDGTSAVDTLPTGATTVTIRTTSAGSYMYTRVMTGVLVLNVRSGS